MIPNVIEPEIIADISTCKFDSLLDAMMVTNGQETLAKQSYIR